MKRLLIAVLASGLSTASLAETENGLFIGLIAGTDNVQVNGMSNASGAGLIAGWRVAPNVAVEYSGFFSESNADAIKPGCTIEIDTNAIYLAGRSSGQFYGKGKIGFLSESITTRDTCVGAAKGSDSGLSIGAGAGYKFEKISIEAEYTMVEADINRLSASIIYNF